MTLAVIGILYGAVVAFGQTDLKRLVAYTSVSHMGFVLLGIFAWNQLALQGAMMVMLAHGLTTGALFILVGDLQRPHAHPRHDRMGGLWPVDAAPGRLSLFFALASLGLPGLGNFVGEFLVLVRRLSGQSGSDGLRHAWASSSRPSMPCGWSRRAFFWARTCTTGGCPMPTARELAIMAVLVADHPVAGPLSADSPGHAAGAAEAAADAAGGLGHSRRRRRSHGLRRQRR